MSSPSTAQKILQFSLTRIIIGAIVIIGVIRIGQIGLDALFGMTHLDRNLTKIIEAVIVMTLGLLSYIYLFRGYENRPITELSVKGISRNLGVGIFLGALLQTLTIGVIFLNHGFTILSVNPIAAIIPALVMAFTSAIIEELLFRGVLFRIIEEQLGSWWALGISAFIFGILHFLNPNATFLSSMAVGIEAGLLLGAAYIYSRNLWFPIAIHFGWNFTQSGIFGANTSGQSIGSSLLTTKIQGVTWISGGPFGPEGSVQAVLFCLMATGVLLYLSYRQGKIKAPFWKERRETLTT